LCTVTHVVDVISADLVPTGVDAADARAQVGALVIRELARGEVDAVVNGVDALNELEVELEPEGLDLGVSLGEAEDSGNNLLAKVLVDETSRRELGLGEARDTKDLGEAALVVVVAVLLGVVDAADVNNNVERLDWARLVLTSRLLVERRTYALRGRECGRGLIVLESMLQASWPM
jgi:hypothetical protein